MVDIIKNVQKMYDEIGTHFSRTRQKKYGSKSSNWPITDKYLAKLKPGDKVLDIGCGNGKLVSGLPEGVDYLGTDFSQTLLNEAKSLYPDHKFVFGNVIEPDHWVKLPEFEAIFCVAVLHHIPEREQQLYVIKQAKSHLIKGGFLYLTVWNLWQEKFAQYHLDSTHLKAANSNWVEIPYNKKWKRFCVSYDIKSMTEIMREAGFEIAEMFYADREGNKSDVINGENLVVVAQ